MPSEGDGGADGAAGAAVGFGNAPGTSPSSAGESENSSTPEPVDGSEPETGKPSDRFEETISAKTWRSKRKPLVRCACARTCGSKARSGSFICSRARTIRRSSPCSLCCATYGCYALLQTPHNGNDYKGKRLRGGMVLERQEQVECVVHHLFDTVPILEAGC